MQIDTIIQGDVLEVLKTLPSESVDCCITSPPYYGLRDYGTAKWEGGNPECNHWRDNQITDSCSTGQSNFTSGCGDSIYKDVCKKCGAKRIDSQIGLEPTPEDYVAKMVEIYRDVRRVLKPQGTCWLNIGDSYAGSGGNGSVEQSVGQTKFVKFDSPTKKISGIKPKDLVGIPWRVAFALQADGWYLRQDIIWNKPNPMPESMTDRCTKSHEYVFLLTKQPQYYFDNEAIKEPSVDNESYEGRRERNPGTMMLFDSKNYKMSGSIQDNGKLKSGMVYPFRNRRSVWTITTKPFMEAHFATFPEDLIEPMIRAGTSEKGVCPDCGKAWERMVEHTAGTMNIRIRDAKKGILGSKSGISGQRYTATEKECQNYDINNETIGQTKTIGWQPSCQCGKQSIPAVVLDIFMGAGTTAVVAKKLGRHFIGIELNPKYIEIAKKRINQVPIRLDRIGVFCG